MTLPRLHDLDWSPARFPDQLDHLLRGGHMETIQALPEDKLADVINSLDDLLGQLDPTSQPFRECLWVLQEICGVRRTLPAPYQISEALSFTSEHPVAGGGFSDVFKGKVGTGADICIKKIRRCATDNAGEVKESFCREAAVWKNLSHPNVVPLIGVTFEPFQLVSQWMSRGELREYVENNRGANLMNLLVGVAEGLAYLHSCDITHGDLKGPNIMVDDSGNARITDFGLATFTQNPDSHKSAPDIDGHTARWCAPELFLTNQPASKESDIFSFGMVMIEVYTGKAPFHECKTVEVMTNIMKGKIPGRPSHVSFTDALWKLTRWCLKPMPSDRPSAEQVLAALKDMGRSRAGSRRHLYTRGGRNDASSLTSPALRDRAPGNPPFRQRRNAGAKPPERIYREKRSTNGPFGSESISAPDLLQSIGPRDLSIEFRSVRNLRTPSPLHKLPNNTEKASLRLHENDSPGPVVIQIQSLPEPRVTTKKHGFWCRFKKFVICGQ